MKHNLRWHAVLTVVLLFAFTASISGQSILSKRLSLAPKSYKAADLIEELEASHDVILSFNGRGLDLNLVVRVRTTPIYVRSVLDLLFADYDYSVISTTDRKILLSFAQVEVPILSAVIRGKVYDRLSGELIVSASVQELYSKATTFSNEYGFYSIEVPTDSLMLRVGFLGYRDTMITKLPDDVLDIYLDFDNELGTVVIKQNPVSDDYMIDNGGERLDLNASPAGGVSGRQDVIGLTRTRSGVQTGNEGQTGYFVRGGSPDQNLTLLDGIPLYEISHIAGISSIFITEAVRDANFSKNGFAARYAGRLNSVLNVTLKEGNKSEYHGSVSSSHTDATAQLEGPLFSKNTSFNIAGRKSLLNTYLPTLYTRYTEYDDIGVDYYDALAKVTHAFSPLSKMMVTYYSGNDDFDLLRNEQYIEDDLRFDSQFQNELTWGTQLLNAQFSNVLTDKFFLNFSLGGSKYRYESANQYEFDTRFGEIISNEYYNLGTQTEIVDYIGTFTGEYFANQYHRLKFGGSYTVHNFTPEIRQSSIRIDSMMIDTMDQVQSVASDEFGLYVEDTYTPNQHLQVYMGFHLSGYRIGQQVYRHLQPRLRTIYQPSAFDRFDLSYARTAQYNHLLVNPGTGLPSELWVPTTESIAPQTADQLSLGYTRKFSNGLRLHCGGYVKWMNDVLEYKNPVNLVFAVLNQIPNVDTSPWDERVVSGSSHSRGLELEASYNTTAWTSQLSYTWSKTDRTFAEINDGDPFPFKYDRRHDIHASISRRLSDSWQITTNWVYGDGNYFTLSVEEVQTIPGVPITIPGDRNNRRFPTFHHLDIQVRYQKKYGKYRRLQVDLGMYNSYNRLNSFYLYLFENPIDGGRIFRKVSIFPLLPQINVGFQF